MNIVNMMVEKGEGSDCIVVGVLCIQGAFIEHVRMLERLAEEKKDGWDITVVDVRKPSQLSDLDGLIIPGGESTTIGVFLNQNGFGKALKEWAFNEKQPGVMWGICAGLILISNEITCQKKGGQVLVWQRGVRSPPITAVSFYYR